ncbi:MAG: tRNA (adenosine(37)-N6)-threonylcarbamoyltransferase complex ATPase subunit type 1 TsaE [Campylobacterota bacterium]|nr:tRNA (adenosine(37)-N6)-threonylcarbamoyltransferase complex ATPase subunit type 1 TsaE [Campylobacterota bacterium]
MIISVGINNINEIVNILKEKISSKDLIILLQGTLASGKTTLVKKYVESVGLDTSVTSPTFSIQSIYGDNIYHYDMYNKTLEEFVSLGLLEEFENSGVHFVEWGSDDLKSILLDYGFDVMSIKIEKKDNKREYKIES